MMYIGMRRGKLSSREDACHAARRLLQARQLPCEGLQVDERPGFFGVRSAHCRMIFARCNGRMVFFRMRDD